MNYRLKIVSSFGILLYLALFCFPLSAEAGGEFTPPRVVTAPVVTIPAIFPTEYAPAEVLVLLNVMPDSSATLVRILDSKPELTKFIIASLTNARFQPAMSNQQPTDATLTLKVSIVRDAALDDLSQSNMNDSLKNVDQAFLEEWIRIHRVESDRQTLYSSVSDSLGQLHPQIPDTFYRTNYFLMGLNSSSYMVMKDGFIAREPIYYHAMQYQLLSNFRDVALEGNILHYANPKYTQSVLCTDIQAALGDYEFNFARGIITKNHLFGLKNLYTEMGFLVQNGYWQQTISDQTSTRVFMSYPIKNNVFSVNLESYNQRFPSTQMLPAWQNYQIFDIDHKMTELYFNWQNPYLNIGYQSTLESISDSTIISDAGWQTQNVRLNKYFDFGSAKLDLTYQYNISEGDIRIPELYSLPQSGKHGFLTSLVKPSGAVHYLAQTLLSEKGLDFGIGSLDYALSGQRIGIDFQYNHSGNNTISNQSLYNAEAPRALNSVGFRKSVAASFANAKPDSVFNYSLKVGSKEYLDSRQNPSGKNLAFGEGFLDFHHNIWGIHSNFQPLMTIYAADKSMLELPVIRFQLVCKLQKELPHDNALNAGINITGHSRYNLGLSPYQTINENAITDLWAGVKITNLFEFKVALNNLGDNTLYGVYPAPRTLLGTIHWFYLN